MNNTNANKSLISGSTWITISELVSGLATLASSIIAARVLAPHDFGLMGVVLLTISILDALSKTGFEQALIQRADEIHDLLNVAWTWHLLRGLLLTALVVIASPFLATWYGEPLLFPLLAISSSYILLKNAQNIGIVFFSRTLEFKKLFLINTARAFINLLIAIPALFILKNVWGLAIGFLSNAALELVISYIAHPYRPSFEWNWKKARSLINFGKWITAANAIAFISNEGDDVFISKYLGATTLGFYRLAYEISNFPATKITHVLSKVSFPIYSRLQHDKAALRAVFESVMRVTLMLSSTTAILIWFLVPYIVELMIGNQWSDIIPVVKILVIAGFIRSVIALGGALFMASNRPDLDFKMNFPRMLAVLFLIWPFSAWWGLTGACFVILLSIVSCLPTWFYGLKKLIGIRPTDVFRINLLTIVSCCVQIAAYLTLQPLAGPGWYGLSIMIAAPLGIWLACMWLLGKISPLDLFEELRTLKKTIKS